jgi:putative spermidine/putrescine transport system substrate-binding protein
MRRLFGWLAVGSMLIAAQPAQARDLTVAFSSGVFGPAADAARAQSALQLAYLRPFADATGQNVATAGWSGDPAALRPKVPATDAGTDIVLLQPEELLADCDQGLLEKLDFATIGGRDHYLPQAVSDCGVGALLASTVITWDRDKLPVAPTWSDFWDVAKYPGKRGLLRTPVGNLEFALLADGVAAGDVYATLRGAGGVDRAFHKLDQLKPYVVWWQPGTQGSQSLGAGEVLMGTAAAQRVAEVNRTEHRNLGIQWAGSLYTVDSWAIVKGSPNLAQAVRLLDFAGNSVQQTLVAAVLGYGVLARPPGPPFADQPAGSPSNPANLANALGLDTAFWHDNRERLTARFEDWVTH